MSTRLVGPQKDTALSSRLVGGRRSKVDCSISFADKPIAVAILLLLVLHGKRMGTRILLLADRIELIKKFTVDLRTALKLKNPFFLN